MRRTVVKSNGKQPRSGKDADRAIAHNPSPFARVDALAVSSLTGQSLARYYSYKQALLDLEQDDESVISTLSIYVWDLFEGRSVRDIHYRMDPAAPPETAARPRRRPVYASAL